MALKPFGRQSKNHAGEEITVDESNGAAQFFSNKPGLPEAGWYPDASDPGKKRYWDGFHWTGQTMRDDSGAARVEESAEARAAATARDDQSSVGSAPRATDIPVPEQLNRSPAEELAPVAGTTETVAPPAPPAASVRVGSQFSATPDASVSLANLDHSAPSQSPESADSGFAVAGGGEERANPKDDEISGGFDAEALKRGEGANHDDSVPQAGSSGDRSGQETVDEANHWAEETERAVARARQAGSPEAWQEVSRVAVVVSELAQAMEAVAHARIAAEKAAQAAQEAAQQANVANKMVIDANQTVQSTAKAVEIAANEARAAEKAAAEARRASEQAALEAPRSAELAKVAAQVAADAERKAKGIDEIIAKARAANTARAWSEAVKLVSAKEKTPQDFVLSS